jgi:hypothetical protein
MPATSCLGRMPEPMTGPASAAPIGQIGPDCKQFAQDLCRSRAERLCSPRKKPWKTG